MGLCDGLAFISLSVSFLLLGCSFLPCEPTLVADHVSFKILLPPNDLVHSTATPGKSSKPAPSDRMHGGLGLCHLRILRSLLETRISTCSSRSSVQLSPTQLSAWLVLYFTRAPIPPSRPECRQLRLLTSVLHSGPLCDCMLGFVLCPY